MMLALTGEPMAMTKREAGISTFLNVHSARVILAISQEDTSGKKQLKYQRMRTTRKKTRIGTRGRLLVF